MLTHSSLNWETNIRQGHSYEGARRRSTEKTYLGLAVLHVAGLVLGVRVLCAADRAELAVDPQPATLRLPTWGGAGRMGVSDASHHPTFMSDSQQ